MSAGDSVADPKSHHISDLVQLVFYICLSLCEYTKFTGHRRTVQLQTLLDFFFFIGDQIVPVDAPIEHFQNITQIVLTLDNQKNTIRGDTVSHFLSESPTACPVPAGVNIFLRLR